jgi:hypothetical protein
MWADVDKEVWSNTTAEKWKALKFRNGLTRLTDFEMHHDAKIQISKILTESHSLQRPPLKNSRTAIFSAANTLLAHVTIISVMLTDVKWLPHPAYLLQVRSEHHSALRRQLCKSETTRERAFATFVHSSLLMYHSMYHASNASCVDLNICRVKKICT